MGDDERRAPLRRAQRREDLKLLDGIDRARRRVEDQDRRIGQQGAGDADALALAPGQTDAALAHDGLVTVVKHADEVGGAGYPGRVLDPLALHPRVCEADVLGDGAAEQQGVLEDDGAGHPDVVQAGMPDVDPVDEHPSRGGVVQAGDEGGQGALARAGGSGHSNGLPGCDDQVNAVQGEHRGALVTQGDVLEADLPPHRAERHRMRRIGDSGRH